MKMQFDVFANPIAAARKAYPYVTVLQSDFAQGARDEIVAPMAPRELFADAAGRLMPTVRVGSAEYVILVPALAPVRRRDLVQQVNSVAAARTQILVAIDYLFFGL